MLPLVWILGGMVAILAFKAPLFAMFLAAFAVIYIVTAVFVSRPVRRVGSEHASAESRQTGALADAITNVMAIKSFARERHERERFAIATDATNRSLLRLCSAHQRQMAYFGTISSTISIAALVVAIYGVVGLNTDVGVVYLIVAYTSSATQQLFQFSNNSLRTYNRAFGDATEMISILRQQPTVRDPEQPLPARIHAGEVRFDDVTFRHAGADDPLFDRLNLTVAAGEKVGLVGHSGAGKTSVTRLLLRFSDVDSGRILIDGQDIASISQADLHAAIAYVPQEPLLFHRSIAREHRLRRARRRRRRRSSAPPRSANAHEFIAHLPRRLRHAGRRARREAVRRAAPADRDRARHPQGRADPDPRRGDLGLDIAAKRLVQDALRTADGRAHDDRHRAPAVARSRGWTASSCCRKGRSPRSARTGNSWPTRTASTSRCGCTSPARSLTTRRPQNS